MSFMEQLINSADVHTICFALWVLVLAWLGACFQAAVNRPTDVDPRKDHDKRRNVRRSREPAELTWYKV